MRSIVLLAVLTLAPPVLGAEFTTLLTAADGEPFAGAPTTVRFVDNRYLVFVQNAHGFPAPHNESTRSRSWALDV